jgi:hypothetical protein
MATGGVGRIKDASFPLYHLFQVGKIHVGWDSRTNWKYFVIPNEVISILINKIKMKEKGEKFFVEREREKTSILGIIIEYVSKKKKSIRKICVR